MDNQARGWLLDKIERERYEMYKINNREPHNTKKLLEISQQLDKLIFQYQRRKLYLSSL